MTNSLNWVITLAEHAVGAALDPHCKAALNAGAAEEWEKNPVPRDAPSKLATSVEVLLKSQRGYSLKKLTPDEVAVAARSETADGPGRLEPEHLWAQDWDITDFLKTATHRADIREQLKPKAPNLPKAAFESWKRAEIKRQKAAQAEIARAQMRYILKEFPLEEFYYSYPVTTKKGTSLREVKITDRDLEALPLVVDSRGDLRLDLPTGLERVVLVHANGSQTETRPTWFTRSGLNYPKIILDREIDIPLHFLEMTARLYQENADLIQGIARLQYNKNPALLRKAVATLRKRHHGSLEELASQTTFHQSIPGPLRAPLTDLVWHGMSQSDRHWDNLGRKSLFLAQPRMEEFLSKGARPNMLYRQTKHTVFPFLVAAAIWAGHNPYTILNSQPVQITWSALKKTGEKIDSIMHSMNEWLNETFNRQEAPPPADKKREEQRKKKEFLSDPQTLPAKDRVKDPEEPSEAQNKSSKEAMKSESNEPVFKIDKIGSQISEADIPTKFNLGFVNDISKLKWVKVPYYRNHNPETSYRLSSEVVKYHAPSNGIVILPRAHSNIPSYVSVATRSGRYIYPDYRELFLNEHGVLYLKLGDEFKDELIQVQLTYDKSRIDEKEPQHPALFQLSPERVLETNQKLRAKGATQMAEKLDAIVKLRQAAGLSIGLHDLEPAFREGARYSFQKAAINSQLDVKDFGRFNDYIDPEGYVCYQCDGAAELLRTYLTNLFEGSPVPIEIERARLMVRENGSLVLKELSYHAEIHVRIQGERLRMELDITPGAADPRDENSKPPVFLSKRAAEEFGEPAAPAEPIKDVPKNKEPEKVEETPKPVTKEKPEDEMPEKEKKEEKEEKEEKAKEKEKSEKENPKNHSVAPFFYNPWYHRITPEIEPSPLEPGEGERLLRALGLMGAEEHKEGSESATAEPKPPPKAETEPENQPVPKPAPMPEPELLPAPGPIAQVMDARTDLLAEGLQHRKSIDRRHKYPHLLALHLSGEVEMYLLTGHGLDVVVARLRSVLGPDRVLRTGHDLREAIEAFKKHFDKKLDSHATALVNRHSGRLQLAHDPELSESTEGVYTALLDYPWRSHSKLEADLQAIAAAPVSSVDDCTARLKALAPKPLYKLPSAARSDAVLIKRAAQKRQADEL